MAQGGTQQGPAASSAPLPVIIIGAGISGLLLAQHLHQQGIPFRIFERDTDLATRGVGWGLTLNWSLPMLNTLVRPELLSRLPETYVDRENIESGVAPRFPFYDLSSGELKATTPPLPASVRVRVTRERLRKWLTTDLNIEVSRPLVASFTMCRYGNRLLIRMFKCFLPPHTFYAPYSRFTTPIPTL